MPKSENRKSQGASTRRRLLEVAEKLFAEQGVGSVSVRAINSAAGFGPAAIHYHFDSKQRLLEAVLMDLGQGVNDQLVAGAERLAARPEPPSAEALVALLTDPYFELTVREPERGPRWMNIVCQLANADDELLWRLAQDSVDAVLPQVIRAFPDASPERVALRWNFMSVAVLSLLGSATGQRQRAAAAGLDFRNEVVVFAVSSLRSLGKE
ncbi:TetR/AcrR family transcriptional regulator [Streptomyces sp. J2-1]|uniref:TetR/AcrR family transcriptional regulator n=1 Tax=Streptomyces corallincola TaxID=2851888 RepID=UPI001C387D0C|nr:TetR/AcrR family transcriptional regulator [Streptomyces corallincola]MBV2353677.1 TetR/AcrR family transcriptional regulator [Streptomyces corallincola]